MRCPQCDTLNEYTTSHRKGITPWGLMRYHSCLHCGRDFNSIQMPLTRRLAETLAEDYEDRVIRLTIGYAQTPQPRE